MKKLLLFGGAFNPPHRGHERLLKSAIDAVQPELIVILPTDASPHKQNDDTRFAHRAFMARKDFEGLGNVKVSEFESRGRRRRNYTLQSVKRLEKKYPGYEIYLLIGGDMLESFTEWSRFRRVLAKVTLVVAAREPADARLSDAVKQLQRDGGRLILLKFEPLVISSSELRGMIREKKDVSAYISDATRRYIEKNGLYL